MTKTPQHNVPELRFPEFEGEWEEKKLGDSIKLLKSGLSRELSTIDIGLPVIRANNIVERKLWLNDLKYWYVDDPKGANTENYHLERQDILVNFINSESKMGTSCIINQVLDRNYIYTTNILRWVTKHNYEPYFHYTITQTSNYIKWIRIITKPAVNQASFTTVDFKNIPYNLPSYQEQQKIGMFFSKLDRQIELEEKKLELLEQQKKGYMQKIFSQELRFKDENGNEYPESKEYRLSEVGVFNSGIGFPEKLQGGTEGIPFFKVSDMNNKGNEIVMRKSNNYVSNEIIDSKNWKVITNVPSMIFAKVGAAIMLNRKRLVLEPFLIDNNTMSYSFSHEWDTGFGRILFQTIYLPKYAQVGAIPSYNAKDIGTIKVKFPTKQEQEKIGEFFNKIDDSIELQADKVELLKQRKKDLLQKMFV